MALRDWTEKQVLGLTAAVVGGILLIMAGLVLYLFLEYTKLGEDIDRLRRGNKALDDKAKTLEDKRRALEEFTAKIREGEERLPDEEQVEELMSQVSEQCRNAHLRVTTLGPARARGRARPGQAQAASKQGYVSFRMQMEASGRFHHLGQFLNQIESRLERVVAVKGFEITGSGDGLTPKEPNVAVKLEFEAYHYKKSP